MTKNASNLSDSLIKAMPNEGEGNTPLQTPCSEDLSMHLDQSGKLAVKSDDRLIKVVTAEGEGDNCVPIPHDKPDDILIKVVTAEGEGDAHAPNPHDKNAQVTEGSASTKRESPLAAANQTFQEQGTAGRQRRAMHAEIARETIVKNAYIGCHQNGVATFVERITQSSFLAF